MLISNRKSAFAIAAALCLSAGAAHATDHEVLILDGAYFPDMIFASEGDRIVFYNDSDSSHVVNGPDGSWTSGTIATNGTYVLDLTETTPLTFSGEFSMVVDDNQVTGDKSGEIVLAGAPTTD